MINRLIDDENPDRLELFLRDWSPKSIVPNEDEPLLEVVALQVAVQRGVKVINHAAADVITKSVCWAYSETRNLSRHIFREGRKIASRVRVSTVPSRTDAKERALFMESARSIEFAAQAFQARGNGESLTIGVGGQASSTASPYTNLIQYFPLAMSRISRQANRFFVGSSEKSRSFLDESHFFSYCELDIFPIVDLWLDFFFNVEFPRLARSVEASERILLEYQPDVVLADNSQLENARIFFLLSRKHAILSIELQHGLLFDTMELFHPEHHIAERHIFWGALDLNKQLAHNGDSSRFFFAGSARFDSFFREPKISTSEAPSRKEPPRVGVTCDTVSKFYGLVGIHNTTEEAQRKYYRDVLEAARRNSEIVFSFKLKNRSILPLLSELISEHCIDNYEILETVQFEDWLSSLSALITDFSTMGLEAMIFDVPVIILNRSEWEDPVGYESSDAVDVAESAEELHRALIASIENPKRRSKERTQFVQHSLANVNGTAAQQTAQVIAELLRESLDHRSNHD